MKKLLFISLISLLVSCSTYKPTTEVSQPTFTLSDSSFCISNTLSASINQDSLLLVFKEGFLLQSGTNSVTVHWESLGTSDPLNGQVVIEPNVCASGGDFCISGKYYVEVHQTAFLTTLQRGMTFGTPQANIFMKYISGKLSLTPKVCIATKK